MEEGGHTRPPLASGHLLFLEHFCWLKFVAVGGAGAILTGRRFWTEVGRKLRVLGDFGAGAIVINDWLEWLAAKDCCWWLCILLVDDAAVTFTLLLVCCCILLAAFDDRSKSAIASWMARSNCEFNFLLLYLKKKIKFVFKNMFFLTKNLII